MRSKEEKDTLRAQGLCPECAINKGFKKGRWCTVCTQKSTEWRAFARANGYCDKCRKEKVKEGCKKCQSCLNKASKYIERLKQTRLASKLCTGCGNALDTVSDIKCSSCLDRDLRHQKRYGKQRKRGVIEAYGGQCVLCGEKAQHKLSIDHIDGRGAEHRQNVVKAPGFYRWLKQNGYPKDNFRLLCHNCNCSRTDKGRG